jgi:hypothetical protein
MTALVVEEIMLGGLVFIIKQVVFVQQVMRTFIMLVLINIVVISVLLGIIKRLMLSQQWLRLAKSVRMRATAQKLVEVVLRYPAAILLKIQPLLKAV